MSYAKKVSEAILELHERGGSSLAAIKKKLALPKTKDKFIVAALKKGVASGTFLKVKGKYRLSKETKSKAAKKSATKVDMSEGIADLKSFLLKWEKKSDFHTDWESNFPNEMVSQIYSRGGGGGQEMAEQVSITLMFRKPHKDWWKCVANVGRGKAKCRANGVSIPAGQLRYEVSCAVPPVMPTKDWMKKYWKTEEHKAWLKKTGNKADFIDLIKCWRSFCKKTEGWWKFKVLPENCTYTNPFRNSDSESSEYDSSESESSESDSSESESSESDSESSGSESSESEPEKKKAPRKKKAEPDYGSTNDWKYKRNGEILDNWKKGYTTDQLRIYYNVGQLTKDTMVWSSDLNGWKAVRNVPNLLATLEK